MKKMVLMLFGLIFSAWGFSAQAAGNDELWEMTTRMEMAGMPAGMGMPPTKITVCQPREGGYQPDGGPKENNCQMTDLKSSGNRTTWKMRCTGKEAMEGTGEAIRSGNTIKQTIKSNMRMEGATMQMTMVSTGKLVGTCDFAATNKKMLAQVEKVRAEAKAGTRQFCEQMVEQDVKNGGMGTKVPEMYGNSDQCPGAKETMCVKARSHAATYQGYAAYADARKRGWGWVPGACGIELETNRASLCQKAQAEKQYAFLGQSCPVEAKALFARNCQGFGRGYTADAAHPNAALCRSLGGRR